MVDRPLVRRRTALGGAVGGLTLLVLVEGCDHGDDIAPPRAGPSSSASTSATPAPEQTADEALVDQVLGALTDAVGVLAHARKARRIGKVLVPLLAAHRRHIAVLEGDPPSEVPPGPPPAPAGALRAVRLSEQQLQAALVDAAGKAESGALARLLASMSASVAQHLALLPTTVGP